MTLTQPAIAAAQRTTSDVVWLCLLTITGSSFTHRFVNNNEEVISRGQTYIPYPFKIVLPVVDGQQAASVKLEIDNVDQAIVQAIRELLTPPKITLEIVTSLDFDQPEIAVEDLVLRDVTYNAMTIEGTLRQVGILNQTFPVGSYDPVEFPGLFA